MILKDLACPTCELHSADDMQLLVPCDACTTSFNALMSTNCDPRLYSYPVLWQRLDKAWIGSIRESGWAGLLTSTNAQRQLSVQIGTDWIGEPSQLDTKTFNFLKDWIGPTRYMSRQKWDSELLRAISNSV